MTEATMPLPMMAGKAAPPPHVVAGDLPDLDDELEHAHHPSRIEA